MEFNISKQSDNDGYSSFQCSLCQEEFKLDSGEVQEDDVIELFCPKCGIPQSLSDYYSEDIIEEAMVIAQNEMNRQLNDMFKGFERKTRSNKNFKFKAGKPLPTKPIKELYEKDDMGTYDLSCCNKKAKLQIITISSKPFCPYCGVS